MPQAQYSEPTEHSERWLTNAPQKGAGRACGV